MKTFKLYEDFRRKKGKKPTMKAFKKFLKKTGEKNDEKEIILLALMIGEGVIYFDDRKNKFKLKDR